MTWDWLLCVPEFDPLLLWLLLLLFELDEESLELAASPAFSHSESSTRRPVFASWQTWANSSPPSAVNASSSLCNEL